MNNNQNINSLSESEVKEISSGHIRGSDKWFRMAAGLASELKKYENGIIYLDIKNTEQRFPSNYETALKLVESWINGNKELTQVKGFVVYLYKTNRSTGFLIPFSSIEKNREAIIGDIVAKMKAEENLTLVGIFSGLISKNVQKV